MKKYLVPYSDEHSNVKIVWDKKRGDFIPLSDKIYRRLE